MTKAYDTGRVGWIRRLAPYLLRNRWSLALTFGAALAGMGAQAIVPLVMRSVVDGVVVDGARPLAPLLGALIGLGLFRFAMSFVRRFFGSKVGVNVDVDLRNDIYDHLHRLDFTRHDEMATGQLVSRANTDVQVLQRMLTFLPILSSNLLLFPLSLVFMATLSIPLTLVSLVTVPVFLWLTMRLRKVVYPSSWDAAEKAAVVAEVVDDSVSGVRVVRAFGQEDREIGRLIDAAETLYGSRVRNIKLSAVRQATLMTVPMIGQVATLALGGWLAIEGRLTVGEFLAFFAYLTQLVAPIGMMAMMLVMAQMARASAERVLEVLDSTPAVEDAPGAGELAEVSGAVEFRNVSFGYLRTRPVLRHFDLRVAPGETVALVGLSGSGKSTVSLLVPRFYDVQEGSVMIDGTDVRDVTIDSLRRNVSSVFEDSFLFADTIRNNIAYGRPDADDAAVEAAARAAGAHRFIVDLPEGYDTVVGEHGLSLSGGQRQRVSLARALITSPRILLLDDATSSVDVAVEDEIHRTLREAMRGRTTILIANRRSSLELADRIVVVGDGRVLDQGTAAELMGRNAVYRTLFADDDQVVPSSDSPVSGSPTGHRRESSADGTVVASTTGGASAPSGFAAGLGLTSAELSAAVAALPTADHDPAVDANAAAAASGVLDLRAVVGPFRWPLVVGLGLVSLDALLRLSGPWFVQWGVDHGMLRRDQTALLTAVAAFAAVTMAGRTLRWFATVHTGRTAQRMLFALRIRVFAHLQRLGLDYYDREMAGRVMTRMTSDINALNALLDTGIVQGVVQVVTLVGTVAILASMSWELTAVTLLVVPPIALATWVYRARSTTAYTRVRDGVATVNARLQEGVSGLRVAKAFGQERRNMAAYRDVTGDYMSARLDSQRLSSLYFPFIEVMSVVATVVVLGVGASMVRSGSLSAGELIAFSLYIATVFAPLQQLSGLFDTYQQAKAAMDKLRSLLALPAGTPPSLTSVEPGRLQGDIVFDHVAFRYAGSDVAVLRDVTVRIEAGQTVALVGETGAGKSTIVKLLARFYDPTSGSIHIDGHPLVELDPSSFRRQLGYVPQEPFLFGGTIRDNIAYGRPDASDEEIHAAAAAVGADALIESLPDGYDSTVVERGRSLSAGGRQLVALARAVLIDPAILLLDEATAHLDLATERQVNNALTAASAGRTTVLVAHRIPTAHRCDRILVVEDGRIVEDGRPDDLVARGGRYAALWRLHEGEAVV